MEQHKVKSKDFETVDSKYIQQHLANERTYLAWLRTAIAIAGLGFLVANLHLAVRKELSSLNNKIAIGIGIGSVIAGISIIIIATLQYLIKRQNINSQTFRAHTALIVWLSLIVVTVILAISSYFLLVI
ncbi:YidH family protein (plasmid) [Bacillus mycoides]|uniref:YidH family protein n=1 Tax=Bacillus mycoides TaxID=1405 RepID=UPI0020D2828B